MKGAEEMIDMSKAVQSGDQSAKVALDRILKAKDALDNAQRARKDAKAEALADQKAAKEEVDNIIGEARIALGTGDDGAKLEILIRCWDAYKQALFDGAERVKGLADEEDAAETEFEEALAASKQAELAF